MWFIKEFLNYLKLKKKYWLLSTFIIFAFFTATIILDQRLAIVPFIYRVF